MRDLPLAAATILRRIDRLARLEHRDLTGQLEAMTELYEKTFSVSGKVARQRRTKPTQIAPPVQKTERRGRKKGTKVSAETRAKISAAMQARMRTPEMRDKMSWITKLAHAKRRLAKLQSEQ